MLREIFGLGDHASALVERADGTTDFDGIRLDLSGLDLTRLATGGFFTVECVDKDGNVRWTDTAKNGVTNAALNDVLNVYLRNTTQTATWYIGLVDNASFTGFAAADSMSSHSGWIENTDYSQGNRVTWSPGAASSQSVTNGTTCDFSMTPGSAVTIRGLFLTSNNTKGGTTGTLFSTAAFSGGNQTVNSGDTLKITYSVSASSS